MDITLRKRSKIIALNEHTSMTVRDIAMAVGVGKSSVSRILSTFQDILFKKKRKMWEQASGHLKNLWHILKNRSTKMNCTTTEQTIQIAVQVLFLNDKVKNMCATLAESMSKRVQEVISAKRRHTSYKHEDSTLYLRYAMINS
ncbi:hypothetical protein TNCV_2543851 [Trichonephila clavipes]|nr:hypothetical protein TNCV_2543851 [Trichonephila clavipes]